MKKSLRNFVDGATPRSISGCGKTAIAVGAASAAASVQHRARQFKCQNPLVGHFIEIDGVKLRYTERGKNQPLVSVHDNGAKQQDFDISGLVDTASANYCVIAFDRLGHGYS